MTSIYRFFQDSYQSVLTVYPEIRAVYATFQDVLQSVADNHLNTTLFERAKTLLKELEEYGINRHMCIVKLSSLNLTLISTAYASLSTPDSPNESLKKTFSRLRPYEQVALNYLNAINELEKVHNCIDEINQALTRLSNNEYLYIHANRTREIGIIMDEIEKLTISITISFSEV